MAIVVVGAGLSGLTCAKVLAERGCRDLVVLDAADRVGGLVTTDEVDGCLVDRGFQVLLDSYPALEKHADIEALEPCYFDSGAILTDGPDVWHLYNPVRHPLRGTVAGLSGAVPLADRTALASVALSAMRTSDDVLLGAEPESVLDFLRHAGISARTIDRFFRPFFGGVLLDNELESPAALFLYYLKKFATGRAFVPRRGVRALPEQLAAALPAGSVRLGTRAVALEASGDRITGVRTSGGEVIDAEAVVLALDPRALSELLPSSGPPPSRGVCVACFTGPESLYDERLIVLPAERAPLVRHFVQLTNVNPHAAPDGRHLVSATILGTPEASDDELLAAARREVAAIFPGPADRLEPLALVRVPHAVPARLPGSGPAQPTPPWNNVRIAGIGATHASIEGAMSAGEAAAAAVLGDASPA